MNLEFASPLAFFSHDHRHCDELWATLEGDPSAAAWQVFEHAMRQHFAMEEEVLFPAFDSKTGMEMGPTFVMRTEHQQMNKVFDDMQQALAEKNSDGYLGLSETLLMLMQQHNMKEENILYPMCAQALGAEAERLGAAMGATLEQGRA